MRPVQSVNRWRFCRLEMLIISCLKAKVHVLASLWHKRGTHIGYERSA
jgi:hypothetical protein